MSQAREIQEMASKISERFAPDKIILFGSHARGDAQEDSDVDLLVLFSELDDPRRRANELYVALAGSALSKDIVVSTTERFERYRNVVNTVYWPAAREGKVLYERPA
jgi:predicted nucleotidyltransferase